MSEQEKTGVEVKKSTYFCDWNGSSWTFKRPDGEAIETRSDLLNELGALIARAEKAEAALESAQKMSDHWEVKAKDWKFQAERNHEAWRNREKLVWNADVALNAAKVETHYTDPNGNRTPLTLGERIKLLAKIRDEFALDAKNQLDDYYPEFEVKVLAKCANALVAELKKEEAERDELKRKLSASEGEKLDLVKLSAVDWQRVRIDAAIAAMQALAADSPAREAAYSAKLAVKHADALVAELKKDVAE